MVRSVALLLTLVTGFSGLAYEVAWQRYLAVLLGAHSEATASVLAIFLGGLAVGYQAFGIATRRLVERARASGRPPRLLAFYGAAEAAIGVYALLFPWLFRAAQEASLWMPTGAGLLAFAADVALATALIGPPAVLMGGTIPVLTQALSRSVADATRIHAIRRASASRRADRVARRSWARQGFDPGALDALWSRCRGPAAACRRELEQALAPFAPIAPAPEVAPAGR